MRGVSSDSVTKIEVTVQSLDGIMIHDPRLVMGREENPTEVTVSCTFTGSPEQMEVGSSTLCSSSGKLMIESDPIDVSRYSPFKAEWQQKILSKDKMSFLPHLTMLLPCRDAAIPLSKANRGSRIQRELPSLDEIDTQSTATDVTASTYDSSNRRGGANSESPVMLGEISTAGTGSTLWSNAQDSPLPDIVELTTRINVQGAGQSAEESEKGVAYLVVFGNDDQGTYLMDLPIRHQSSRNATTRPSVYLAPDARLRVKVRVYSRRRKRVPVIRTTSSSSSSSEAAAAAASLNGRDIYLSRSLAEEQIAPLMERIRRNEENALRQREAQKRAMDVHVPLNRTGLEENPSSSSVFFCNGLWNWSSFWSTLACAVTSPCEGKSYSSTGSVYQESAASVTSTIATRPSWK